MDMIGHDHVGKDENAVVKSRLSPSIAEYLFELVLLEDRQAVVSDRCEVISGSSSGDLEHFGRGGAAAGIL